MYKGLVWLGVIIATLWAIAEPSYESALALVTALIVLTVVQRDNNKTK